MNLRHEAQPLISPPHRSCQPTPHSLSLPLGCTEDMLRRGEAGDSVEPRPSGAQPSPTTDRSAPCGRTGWVKGH